MVVTPLLAHVAVLDLITHISMAPNPSQAHAHQIAIVREPSLQIALHNQQRPPTHVVHCVILA